MQAEKKNPSDPDAVVTADAGAVLLMATGISSLANQLPEFCPEVPIALNHHGWGLLTRKSATYEEARPSAIPMRGDPRLSEASPSPTESASRFRTHRHLTAADLTALRLR